MVASAANYGALDGGVVSATEQLRTIVLHSKPEKTSIKSATALPGGPTHPFVALSVAELGPQLAIEQPEVDGFLQVMQLDSGMIRQVGNRAHDTEYLIVRERRAPFR